ncbi:uracil phosphoribosyltransferase [Prochlorococcus sp. MIT 1223]|uniref:uracil phosphoribosyltransferase n=1 Tax=Prochlorococcus sp. MIT 1223 TaxID=3096217 RepID=UPI002A757134|nr:uracil phosphoribosyltransferase [Prochlorococcus sp. MIT 1223]
MPMTLKIIVPPHPVIAHWLSMLRNETTPSAIYSTGLEQLGKWLTYEAIREWLPNRKEEIKTTHGKTEGFVIESRVPLLAIPNLPGGLMLWQGGRDLLPNAVLCLSGVPKKIEPNSGIVIYLDQISTGEILLKTIKDLNKQHIEGKRIRIICAIASSEGLKLLGESFSDLTIYAACIDPELKDDGSLYPGIGNPEKRINTIITR